MDFSPPEDSRHKHQALRREELSVSGYYYQELDPQDHQHSPPTDDQCVAWLAQSLDGPYAGKQDRINKLSFALSDDTLTGFMKFYTALRAGLNACGFSPHLLPLLPLIRPDANLIDTPIIESSLLVIGTGQDPANLRQPTVQHWQREHDSLGMTLYALLLEAIRKTAFQAYSALNNQLQLGAANGFTVLQEIIRRHHPRIANTLAPSYATILANQPKMIAPGREGTYELSHTTYLATFCDWETQLSYYQEFIHFCLTQLLLGYIHGLVRELRPHVLSFENLLIRHHTAHRFKLTEPSLPSQCDADELHLILKAGVQGLDMAPGRCYDPLLHPTLLPLTLPLSILVMPRILKAAFSTTLLNSVNKISLPTLLYTIPVSLPSNVINNNVFPVVVEVDKVMVAQDHPSRVRMVRVHIHTLRTHVAFAELPIA
jgi:hypothetical protein